MRYYVKETEREITVRFCRDGPGTTAAPADGEIPVLTIQSLLGRRSLVICCWTPRCHQLTQSHPASAARIIETSSLHYPYLEIPLYWTDSPTIVAYGIPSLWTFVVGHGVSDFVDVSGR